MEFGLGVRRTHWLHAHRTALLVTTALVASLGAEAVAQIGLSPDKNPHGSSDAAGGCPLIKMTETKCCRLPYAQ